MSLSVAEPESPANPTPSRESPRLSASADPRRPWARDESHTRILYADDDVALRNLGQQVLARLGYQVDTADDGAHAWAALHDQHYHLLITDNQMPRLTGVELIRKLRLAGLTVPVILASGTVGALAHADLPWLERGALLAKPFTVEQLLSTVREVLRAGVSARSRVGVRLPVG